MNSKILSLTLTLTAFALPVCAVAQSNRSVSYNDEYENEGNVTYGDTRPRRVSDVYVPQPAPDPAPAPRPEPRPTTTPVTPPAANDRALADVRRLDQNNRDQYGQLGQTTAAEHLRRATIYHSNRAFAEARAHWQALLDRYPYDTNRPVALFGIGRAYFQEQNYNDALPQFEQVAEQYPDAFEGREGRYYIAATLLRLGRFSQSAARYADYIRLYPQGERLEAAHLNAIDTWREAGNNRNAMTWIQRTRAQFPGTITETNAAFAQLRLDLATGDWYNAIQTADELRSLRFGKDVLTDPTEIAFLRAYALERAGRTNEAITGYLAIPDRVGTYHGSAATERLQQLAPSRADVRARVAAITKATKTSAAAYPLKFRAEVLRAAQRQSVDPRLILAIMKQESGFNPSAKSPSAARGLLQLVIDTARKYGAQAGYPNFREDDLYRPEVNTALGAAYLAELQNMFPDNAAAVIGSYNGGEENVARWVRRANSPEPALFAAEVGFSETKLYVFKVMSNYRAYQTLYTNDLRAR